eukprot:TRINITY_DN9470_c0_g1_i1.p1 TRINITY_DN9470_c0_g1~~TRINITY_DN9470_c0_g1_i1.p1  ORF type:complete len:291 (+),score=52.78 TRINITY_DN9470_c0_g1_i1:131-1003(+)
MNVLKTLFLAGTLSHAVSEEPKQKALYVHYTYNPSLVDVPATNLTAEVVWTSTSKMKAYGKNGIFAAQPVGSKDGVGGYFGSQDDGGKEGQLLFSIWDKQRKDGDTCRDPSHTPNSTWCSFKHALPVSTESCHRNCNDCGLHPTWTNTTGTQCYVKMDIKEGQKLTFTFERLSRNESYLYQGYTYYGSTWRLSASGTHIGTMFWEDTFEGIDRLSSFHEHIGYTPCDSFYEEEMRTGPFITSPSPRSPVDMTFTPPKQPANASCLLYNVTIDKLTFTATFATGPGTGPSI